MTEPRTTVSLSARGSPAVRRLLIGLTVAYPALVVLAPVGALVWQTFAAAQPADRPLFDPPLLADGVETGVHTAPTPDAGLIGRIGHIAAALTTREALTAFGLTLTLAAAATVINVVFGTVIAWILVRQRFRLRGLVNGLIDLPFAVSPVVAGYMLLLLYGRGGWFGGLTQAVGTPVAFAFPGALLATVFVSLPFVVREVIPVLEEIGFEQDQAAATLGAGPWQTFRLVTLPGLKWALLYGAVLTAARALGEYGAVAVVGGAVAGKTETATLFVDRMLLERREPTAYAASLGLVLLSLAFLVILELLKRRRTAD